VPQDKVILCQNCKRRAYCSSICRESDLKPDVGAQNHKFWCTQGIGKEDLDWKIVPYEGKGVGVVALRDFPLYSKIMVDPVQKPFHPKINELVGVSLADKLKLNCFNSELGSVMCLRISRVNHDCRRNCIELAGE